MDVALGPTLVTRGDWGFYALAVLMTALAVVDVAFPGAVFRWRYRWRVKDPEPTDFYLRMNELGGGVAAVVLFVVYLVGVTKIV